MDIGERNSRLLLIIGGVGLYGILFKFIGEMIISSYSAIRLNEIPISTSQLFTSLLLASFIVILALSIAYCYNELYVYSKLDKEKKDKYLNRADSLYLYILRYGSTSAGTIVLISILFSMLGLFLAKWKYILLIMVIILIILILIFFVKRDTYKQFSLHLKNLFQFIKPLFNGASILITFYSFIIWLISFIFCIALGIEANTNAKVFIAFDNNQKFINIIYEDKVPDFFPKEFVIGFENDRDYKELVIDGSEFKQSFTSVIKEISNDQTSFDSLEPEVHSVISKGLFHYSYNLDMEDYITSNTGVVYIQFEVDQFSTKETYTVKNIYSVDKNKLEFELPEISIELK